MTVQSAIKRAEAALPGVAAPAGERDARWQRILDVGGYAEAEPELVWAFIARWGQHEDPDLRQAIGLCLLEHLLGYHFALIFPRVEQLAQAQPSFAETFRVCRKMGQAELPAYARRWDALLERLSAGPAA